MKLPAAFALLLTLVSAAQAEAPARYLLADNIFTRLEDTFGPAQTPHPAVVRVIAPERDGMSLGSGTLVDVNDTHGLIVTNWHVVRDSSGEVWVVFPDGFRSPGYVLKTDEAWDLAAVAVQKPKVAPVRLATQAAKPGEMLTIAGYGRGKYRSASGQCTQYVAPDTQSPFEMVEVAVSARQGDSGGPILNSRGEMAGVLFGEGGGRTAGSYCGRVHQFLAGLQTTPQQQAALLAAVPSRSTGTSASSSFAGGNSPIAPLGQPAYVPASTASLTSVHEPDWRQGDPRAPLEPGPPSTAADAFAADAWTDRAATVGSRSTLPPREDEPAPPEFDWRRYTGDTPLEQVKSALATVGALALAIHGLRWLRTG